MKIRKEIKKHLSNNRLSVIVGAGFSLNASDKYLSWKELLHDMIVEMYGSSIKCSSEEHKQFVDKIISEKGYLAIASEYVKRYGYHEAIDLYIEERTPVVKKEGDDYLLILDGEKLSEPADLSLHKLLAELNWNNIYTFNYDNLLDVAAGADRYNEIENEINNYRIKNNELLEEQFLLENERTDLEQQNATIKNKTRTERAEFLQELNYVQNSPDDSEDNAADVYESNKNKIEEIQEKERENKNIVNENNNKIELLNKKQKNLYHLVDSAFKISLRKTQNLYKLHGNIRLNQSDRYGFDQDTSCQYIITQEDYDSYREKHEAFVTLMRIALLQDYFCLIGFSGDDPNFMSWLAWVKDIIDQRAQNEKSSNKEGVDAKIFFVDVSGKPLDKGKKLFFKNHYIKHVPLLDKPGGKEIIRVKVKEFLESLKSEKKNTNEAIEEYRLLWATDTYSVKEIPKDYVLGYKRSEIRLAWQNREYNRLPKLSAYASQKRRHVIGKIESYIKNQTVDEDIVKLLLLASQGELLPVATVIKNKHLDKLEEQFTNHNDILLALKNNRARHRTLRGEKELDDLSDIHVDESRYETILRMLFNLDFTSAKKTAEEWETEDYRWRVTNFVLKRLLGIAEENDFPILSDFDLLNYNNQELIYSLQLLKRIMFWNYTEEQKSGLDNFIDKIKNSGFKKSELNNLDDNIEYLIRKINEQKVNTSPYGDSRIVYTLGADNLPLIHSIQILQYLIETVHPLAESRIFYFNKDDWYSVFKNIYKTYPQPCLFYSLQYGNEKEHLQKIAQDYVYTNDLRSFCKEALVKMLRAYLMAETPLNIKDAILIVAPAFFTYVPNELWQSDFEEIYNKSDLSDRSENRAIFNPIYDFLITGMKHSKNKPFNRRVLYKMLKLGEKIDNIDNRMIIAAKENVTIKTQPKEVKESINYLITEGRSMSTYFVLFNLQTILTKEQSSLFLKKLLEYDYINCHEPNMITASLSYAKGTKLEDKIKADILYNASLWKHGIQKKESGDYSIGRTSCLPVFTIQKYTSFSTSMLNNLYDKLKDSLNEILHYHKVTGDKSFTEFINPGNVISEMFIFLESNKRDLEKYPDYSHILLQVQNVYTKIYGSTSIMDALVSSDKNSVNKGIAQLSYRVQYMGFKHFEIEYITIANIVLKRMNAGLSNSILHFTDIVSNKTEDIDKRLFKPIIDKILDVYQPYFSDANEMWDLNVKKELVEDAMISLNKIIIKWGKGSKFWNNHQRLFDM